MRPEEVTALRRSNIVSLPEADGEWGEFLLTDAQARSGARWSDDGKSIRPRRELKHRAAGETRPVPMHPDLVTLLHGHIAAYGYRPGGRIFSLPRGGVITNTDRKKQPSFSGTDLRPATARTSGLVRAV